MLGLCNINKQFYFSHITINIMCTQITNVIRDLICYDIML